MFNFNPFPELETKNLILRKMREDDAFDLFEMRKDARMNEFTDTKPDENINETKTYIERMNRGIDENRWIIWAIEHKESKKVIGSISIWNIDKQQRSGETGYGIIPDYQGQGLMKEALLRIEEYGFENMSLKVLYAYTEENNIKSIGLLKNCGFIEGGRVCDKGYYNNREYHMIVYKHVR